MSAEFENERALFTSRKRGSQAGFIEHWDELSKGEGFAAMMEEKYNITWRPETEEQAAAREVRQAAGVSIFEQMRTELESRNRNTNRSRAQRNL